MNMLLLYDSFLVCIAFSQPLFLMFAYFLVSYLVPQPALDSAALTLRREELGFVDRSTPWLASVALLAARP